MGVFSTKPKIQKLSAKRDVEGLIRALGHKDDKVRNEAAIALGQLGDPKAVPSLTRAFLEDKYSVSESAAKALLQIRNAEGVGSVIGALGSKSSFLRGLAAQTLGENEANAAIPALIVVLTEDADWNVRKKAAAALQKIGWQPRTDAERAFLCVAQGEFDSCVLLGHSAIGPLIEALEEKHSHVNASIEYEVSMCGGPSAHGFQDYMPDILGSQIQIMHALRKIGGAETNLAIDKQKQAILTLIRDKMSNKPVWGTKYARYWLLLGLMISIANFPDESTEITRFVSKITAASCEHCGQEIPKEILSTFSTASDFAMIMRVTSSPYNSLEQICPSCGWPQIMITLEI